MNDQDDALTRARRFAATAFAAALDTSARKFQNELVAVRSRAAAQSSFPSGTVTREISEAYARYIDNLSLTRLNTLMEGYELHGVTIDEQLAASTVEEVMSFKDTQLGHAKSTPEEMRGNVAADVFAQMVLKETTVMRASITVEVERQRLKPRQELSARKPTPPFRWEDFDQRLLSHKLQEISEEMQKRSADGERKAAYDTQKSGNSAGYLSRLFDFQEQLTDEWVEKVYVAHCETWVQQNRVVTGQLIRAVRDRAVMQVIAARKSTVQFHVSLRRTRISEPVNPVSLRSWNMRMDRLAVRWSRKLEAEAVAEEYRAVRPAQVNDDRQFYLLAIEEAKKSVAEDERPHPRVGAIVVKNGTVIAKAHRGENPKSHAEYVALEEKLPNETITGATVYTTLEPCTKRNPPKICCAQRLVDRKVARVFIGMLDPNPDIRGLGEQLLSEAGIEVQLFPRDLRSQVEELNREFIRTHKGKQRSNEVTDKSDKNLYNRRFDIFSTTLDFYHVLLGPVDSDSDLENVQRRFAKASREAKFLFDPASGVHKLLEQMHADAMVIIGYRSEAPKFNGPDLVQFNQEFNEAWSRIHAAIPLLEDGMAKYLTIHDVHGLPTEDSRRNSVKWKRDRTKDSANGRDESAGSCGSD